MVSHNKTWTLSFMNMEAWGTHLISVTPPSSLSGNEMHVIILGSGGIMFTSLTAGGIMLTSLTAFSCLYWHYNMTKYEFPMNASVIGKPCLSFYYCY